MQEFVRPVKIAYLVHDYHRAGGHSRYVAELASRFAKQHEVHVFANRIEGRSDTHIHFHHVPAWRANALTTVLTFAIPASIQPGRGFDIIHSQGFCGFRGNVFTGHICNRAWHLALQKLEGGVTLRESVFNSVATSLERFVYRYSRGSGVVAVSERVANDLVEFYGCRAPMRVIHHGVDLELFSPQTRQRWRAAMRAEYGLRPEETAFLYVGDLRKGATRCISALSKLERGKLLLASRSPREPYQRMVERAGLSPERVLFLGATNQVERVYSAADALLLPTPYDAFAMVVSEAMACGLPVVVSREAGASELIEDGVNGLVLKDATSIAELAACMQLIAESPERAAQIGNAARQRVEPMSWDAVARQTMQFYEELLQS